MNIYYIKQKLSLKDKYMIYDINEKPVLQVTGSSLTVTFERIFGSLFSIGHILQVNNLEGEKQFIIKRKPGFLWKRYDIIIEGDTISVNQNKNLFVPKMYINARCSNCLIKGDILAKNFSITKDGVEIAQISKKTLSLQDIYEICVYEDHEDKLAIAILIAMDNCYHN
ncbi:LURP-one-related family protein [Clostridium algidicarnis]|uniref:LURP-one-related/scramblase family protein n=2 Tax=Clostridium algidicarnis TaxID=37659 RepID=UPI001C0C7433|nr:LURP-one-related family protein [Clostridium algidicarnis]MBU3251562.1 LURP-one-related family protein [Clostridium algidicarnis]